MQFCLAATSTLGFWFPTDHFIQILLLEGRWEQSLDLSRYSSWARLKHLQLSSPSRMVFIWSSGNARKFFSPMSSGSAAGFWAHESWVSFLLFSELSLWTTASSQYLQPLNFEYLRYNLDTPNTREHQSSCPHVPVDTPSLVRLWWEILNEWLAGTQHCCPEEHFSHIPFPLPFYDPMLSGGFLSVTKGLKYFPWDLLSTLAITLELSIIFGASVKTFLLHLGILMRICTNCFS